MNSSMNTFRYKGAAVVVKRAHGGADIRRVLEDYILVTPDESGEGASVFVVHSTEDSYLYECVGSVPSFVVALGGMFLPSVLAKYGDLPIVLYDPFSMPPQYFGEAWEKMDSWSKAATVGSFVANVVNTLGVTVFSVVPVDDAGYPGWLHAMGHNILVVDGDTVKRVMIAHQEVVPVWTRWRGEV